ncbi:MAG: glycosyltransferase family 2 protein [Longibaculum sp.]
MCVASIIVALNNEFELTENFINNINQVTNEDIEKIIVVDGMNDINSIKYLEELDQSKSDYHCIFLDNNIGYSKANNIGVDFSNSELLIFLNSDTFPIEDSLYRMIDYMNKHTDVGVCQGLILYPQTLQVQSTGHIFSCYQSAHALDGNYINNPLVLKEQERQALGSGFYITRKSLFLNENGFDEFYYNAWEGLEYSLKIHLKGLKCMYIPNAKAYHIKSSGRSRMVRNETYQAGYFWSKWGGRIKEDISNIYLKQLSQDSLKFTYILVQASSMKYNAWETFLDKLSFKILLIHEIKLSFSKKQISLEDSLPQSIIESHHPLIFLTDDYSYIINNKRIFNYRSNKNDIILDLKGNVIMPFIYHNLGS